MKGDPTFVILKYSAWLDTNQFEDKILGAVVRYPLRPTNEYTPASPLRYNNTELIEGVFTEFVHDSTRTVSHDASAALQSLVGFEWKGRKEASVHLRGKRLRYKRLQQHAQFWSQLKTDDAVRDLVPRWISMLNTWPPCLVVGIMTAEDDIELSFSHAAERERHVDLGLPVAAAAAAAATAATGVPVSLLGDVGVGNVQTRVGASGKEGGTFTGRSAGGASSSSSSSSRIFALELRVVTTALFRRLELQLKEDGPKVHPGRLAGNDGQLSGGEDESEPPAAEDLILDMFTEEEYNEMDG